MPTNTTQFSPIPTFFLPERDRRWNLARMFMESNGLDAILVIGEHEDAGPANYSYDTWFTNTRPGTTVLLPRTGLPHIIVPAPMFVLDHMEAGDEAWFPQESLRHRPPLCWRHSGNHRAWVDEGKDRDFRLGTFYSVPA